MSKPFKLIKEEFSDKFQECWWTYECLFEFTFKKKSIAKITITDHPWKKPGREWITKELVLNILVTELNGRQRMKPKERINNRDIYVREWVPYGDKDYLLVFWFEDGNSDWLWVRNCYPVS
ncbi:hypothetical protein [endosymbiont GvMRE of Glomus versiforme]|uniref:hypothetical protein n=1 Tax=endosymbiont GvMRE of Glomus versiforme TaxID=2039283 RepID=UPI000EC0BBC1|nr:hypothetical protein [endosymbiont GvMRE of Glomus versiforme]RHZ36050.1 hypothetical protein GvMRE_Ic3g91 [endosymbiont GvMRE of Glomus versiforme]